MVRGAENDKAAHLGATATPPQRRPQSRPLVWPLEASAAAYLTAVLHWRLRSKNRARLTLQLLSGSGAVVSRNGGESLAKC